MPPRAPSARQERKRLGTLTLAAAAISLAMLGGCWFVEVGSPANQERWRWMIGVALVAVALTGAAIVFGRRQMRAIFRAPLTGLFAGLVGVVLLGGAIAGIEWIITRRPPLVSLRAAALAGLPAGAVLGVGIGLIGWAVFSLIPRRARAAEAGKNRPRFQFSLRTLLFAVLVVALALWVARPAQRNYQHQRAVSQLVDLGARIEFEGEKTGDWFEAMIGGRLGPQWYADVRGLTLGANTTDDDLRLLEHLTEVRHLRLAGPQVTDAGFAYVARLRSLKSAYFHCPQVTAQGFGALAHLPRLDAVDVCQSALSDEALANLMSAPALRQLSLMEVAINGNGLTRIRAAPIQILAFHGVNITDADLQHLSGFPAIEHLTLVGTNVTDAGLANLSRIQTLRHLALGGAGFTGKGLRNLAAISTLQSISLNATSVRDADLITLAAFPRLEAVHFRGTLISDAGLEHLKTLPSLRHVSIYGTWVTKAGADKLRAVLQAKKPPGTVYGI